MNLQSLLRLLRPHQWLKNGFVFIGVLFGRQWQADQLIPAAFAFLSFCAVASAVYVFNDLVDAESDRQHPVKRHRPIASGEVGPRLATFLFVALLILGGGLAALAGTAVLGCVTGYLALNVAYTLRLKHIAILDVFAISAGFMLRILAGTLGIGIEPSSWLLLCGMMITLFLGFAKRGAELRLLERRGVERRGNPRFVLGEYGPTMIEQFMSISAACAILSYSLYTVSPETVARHGTDRLIFTVPFVIYGIYRYVWLLHQRGGGNDASRDLYNDPHLLVTVAGWSAATLALLW